MWFVELRELVMKSANEEEAAGARRWGVAGVREGD
jgi:hypothetical protein